MSKIDKLLNFTETGFCNRGQKLLRHNCEKCPSSGRHRQCKSQLRIFKIF